MENFKKFLTTELLTRKKIKFTYSTIFAKKLKDPGIGTNVLFFKIPFTIALADSDGVNRGVISLKLRTLNNFV